MNHIDDNFVTAVNTHGTKQSIPRAWLDHPVLGVGFRLPPSAQDTPVEVPSLEPSVSWTRAQLDAHAARLGVDTTSASSKADALEAINAAPTQIPDPAQGSDNTPPVGDDKEN